MANITNNNFNEIELKISKTEYWDFILSKQKDPSIILDGSYLYDDILISHININDDRCVSGNSLYSTTDYKWANSINNGLTLHNFGFNGVDNGMISFNKENINSDEFYNILTESTLRIENGDTRLILNMVSGNTNDYTYPFTFIDDINGKYILLEGGFYQGFFKSGDEYCVLPNIVENEISFEFILKPDFVTMPKPGTLNAKYPNNKGIFFYLGARSESKFWYEYLKEDANEYQVSKTGQTTPLDFYTGNTLETTDGFTINEQNTYDIITDNKYLLFDRTSKGQVASTFNGDKEYHITGIKNNNLNYYNYFNRTATGYTASNTDSLTELTKSYSAIDDIISNSIAFRIKDDGSIGYRTINKYCTGNTDEYVVDEEYSSTEVITDNELTFINIRMVMNGYSECGNSNREFKLYFYVNGKLVFVSKNLPELMLRNLADTDEKQETIPYNISIGGGSQGLCDMIGFNTGFSTQYLLPIEKYFAGSMIGNIHQFKVYYGKMDYSKIQNNFIYQSTHVFNPDYSIPTIKFWISGLTITAPETTYKREIGNTATVLNAIIKLNDVYHPITGYKLYYYPESEQRVQLNGTFNMPQSGSTIPEYIHNDLFLANSGLTSLKYMIEVLDTYNYSPGTEKIETIIFDNMIFYGSTNSQPINGGDIRLLENKTFNNDTTTFTLKTGAINKIFIIAIPSGRELFSVYDQDAIMANITRLFNKVQMQVPDAGGLSNDYDVYIMENAIPYSRNHNFIVTLN